MTFEASGTGIVAGITRRAAERLRAGSLWVYRSDVERVQPAELAGGALVTVVDGRGIPLGTALYSDASEIALRMVSRQAEVGRAEYLGEVRERVRSAIRLRERVAAEAFSGEETNACRLVFSEADELPGIVMDRYGSLVVAQLLTQGTAQDDVRGVLAEVLAEQVWVTTVVERPDARVREQERLAAAPEGPLFVRKRCKAALQTVFTIMGCASTMTRRGAEDRGVSGPAAELCGCGEVGAWSRSRRVYLSGRVCAASGAGVRAGDGSGCEPRGVGGCGPESGPEYGVDRTSELD